MMSEDNQRQAVLFWVNQTVRILAYHSLNELQAEVVIILKP